MTLNPSTQWLDTRHNLRASPKHGMNKVQTKSTLKEDIKSAIKKLLMEDNTQKQDKTNWHRTKGDKEYLYQWAVGHRWQQDRQTTSTKVTPKDTQNRKQNYWNKTQSGRRDLTWTWLNSTWRVMTVAGGLLVQPDGNNAAPWTHQRHPADEMIQLCRNHHFHKLSTEHWLTWWDTLAIHIILKQSYFKLIEKLREPSTFFPHSS